jgi:hypothetical protein
MEAVAGPKIKKKETPNHPKEVAREEPPVYQVITIKEDSMPDEVSFPES